nr:IE0 [Hyphantria cunea nucleopolyhedrovirus]UIX56283.1 IE0 [Hyphantria cunea nucleopolyhedrovirus]
MIKGTYWPNMDSGACETSKMIDFNFIFAHMYNADILTDAKAQAGVRAAAFVLVDDKHYELYKRRIENGFFRYRDECDDSTTLSTHLPKDSCCHNFIDDAVRVIDCVKKMDVHNGNVNVIVLLPYLKQLQAALALLHNAFACCSKTIDALQMYVQELLLHCLQCADRIETAGRTLQVMNLFLGTHVLYECDLCKEASTDRRFLKPQECCQYALCNACCVTLWKTASTHAKCPACSTSFKS